MSLKALDPRLVWSPALHVWCCSDSNYRACAQTKGMGPAGAREAYAFWASEIAILILCLQSEIDHVHTTH